MEYEVTSRGSGYAHKWWIVKLEREPTRPEAHAIALKLDGGYLFGSHYDVVDRDKGLYKISGYID